MSGRILLIDDASTVRLMQRRILEERGYEIVGEAASGLDGYDMFTSLKPDLTILDITMPIMDGLETLKKIRARHYDAKIVMCSANWVLVTVMKALHSGAIDFVTKPFQRDRFIFTIENAFMETREFNEELLTELINKCDTLGNIPVSQDQISELISYVHEDNAIAYSVEEIMENLGSLYQQSAFDDSTLGQILHGQNKILHLLEQVLSKLS